MADRDELDWIEKYEPWRLKEGEKEIVELTYDDKAKFAIELLKIKGIGKETTKDITDIYASKDDLIKDLESGSHVPLGNRHVKILKKHFGITEGGI